MIGKLKCLFAGHLRRKRVAQGAIRIKFDTAPDFEHAVFECPRCRQQIVRKSPMKVRPA